MEPTHYLILTGRIPGRSFHASIAEARAESRARRARGEATEGPYRMNARHAVTLPGGEMRIFRGLTAALEFRSVCRGRGEEVGPALPVAKSQPPKDKVAGKQAKWTVRCTAPVREAIEALAKAHECSVADALAELVRVHSAAVELR